MADCGRTYGGWPARKVAHGVSVIVLHGLDGCLVPLTILWDDGRRLRVELVGEPRRERSVTRGYAIRHDVLVEGRRRVLWRDGTGWFVEVRER